MRRPIYNLEFPSWCNEIRLHDYLFLRVDEYETRLQELQHLVGRHSEFRIVPTTGTHSITAIVEHAEPEPPAVLEWAGDSTTALMDLLLILSLFTKRDVFGGPKESEVGQGAIIRDPRGYAHGGILLLSIPYVGQPVEPEPYRYNIGFEQGLNEICGLIRDDQWRDLYRGGYFLFLANQAFKRQSLEASFVQSWTIWEHLFSIHNSRWLSDASIHSISAHEKISFVLAEYGVLQEIDDAARGRIRALSRIRNRLVHFGRFPERDHVNEDAILFIQLTEWIIATILQLEPSNALNTTERLEEFLSR